MLTFCNIILNIMSDRDQEKEYILGKLHQIFKDGYRPMRGDESYNTFLKNGSQVYDLVNCFGHTFNLRNQQFEDYNIKPYRLYGRFSDYEDSVYFENKTAQSIFDFIKETGLKIEECKPDDKITDFRSWKIALYFYNNWNHKDFHFLLEEKPKKWSSKLGFHPYVEHVNEDILPHKFLIKDKNSKGISRKDYTKKRHCIIEHNCKLVPPSRYSNMVEEDPYIYEFYGTYKITNINADENNRYVKDRIL